MDISSLLIARVGGALKKAGPPKRLLVGVSGGADSVALLRLLCHFREETRLKVIHVRHDLRAEAADDAHFVELLCETLDVPCEVCAVHVPRVGSVEDAARAARYEAFAQAYKDFHADALALAHHMDDQAETVLMHLAHGCGANGLAGMRETSLMNGMRLLRPLLSTGREELGQYLDDIGQPYCTDATNADTRYTRNFLRLKILPALEERFTGTAANLARTAQILADEDKYFEDLARETIARYGPIDGPCRFLMLEAVKEKPVAVRRRVLRQFLSPSGEMTFQQTQEVDAALFIPGTIVNLPNGFRMLATSSRLHLIEPGYDKKKPRSFDKQEWLCQKPFNGETGDGARTQAMDEALYHQAVLRTRSPGDRITPFGSSGSRPLKEYLIDRKVDQPFRDETPLLCIGTEVLWVLGVGASEALRVKAHTEPVLLQIKKRLPWDIGR